MFVKRIAGFVAIVRIVIGMVPRIIIWREYLKLGVHNVTLCQGIMLNDSEGFGCGVANPISILEDMENVSCRLMHQGRYKRAARERLQWRKVDPAKLHARLSHTTTLDGGAIVVVGLALLIAANQQRT